MVTTPRDSDRLDDGMRFNDGGRGQRGYPAVSVSHAAVNAVEGPERKSNGVVAISKHSYTICETRHKIWPPRSCRPLSSPFQYHLSSGRALDGPRMPTKRT